MERVCFQLSVRPDRLEEYTARHRSVWPEMLDALHRTGWRNYSLFLREDGMLIGYLECEDFAAAQRGMEEEGVNARWQAEMAGFSVSDGPPDQNFRRLAEIFHLD